MKKKKQDNKGFTLIELVIVVAILAILIGILAPQYTKYVEKARKAADASNMDDMVNAIKLYAADGAHHLQTTEYQLIIGDGTGGTTGGTVLIEPSAPAGTIGYRIKSRTAEGVSRLGDETNNKIQKMGREWKFRIYKS